MTLTQNYIVEDPPVKNHLQPVKFWLRIIFYVLCVTCLITYFTKDNYRAVNIFRPEVLSPPIQKAIVKPDPFSFVSDDYEYNVMPLYDYEMNAVVVHKYDYTRFKFYKLDSVFPLDLCVVWGENVSQGTFKNKTVRFSQDGRFCRYQGEIPLNGNEISNNHLVINDDSLERKLKNLSHGDQIKIVGKLVNIDAKNVGKPVSQYDYESFKWGTSTTRGDSGAGACETIFVEDVEILKKANPVSFYLFNASYYSLVLVVLLRIIFFFQGMKGPAKL